MGLDFDKFKHQLIQKKAELQSRLDRLKNEAIPLDQNSKEAAIELENEEVSEELDQEARLELVQINNALDRITKGTYGRCTSCSDPIPTKRLEALPFANHCLACAS